MIPIILNSVQDKTIAMVNRSVAPKVYRERDRVE